MSGREHTERKQAAVRCQQILREISGSSVATGFQNNSQKRF